MLFNFTLIQLLRHNIHLGSQIKYWSILNTELVAGRRQYFYISNCNLTVVNLRKSFLLIEILLNKFLSTLFYHYDLNFKPFFVKNLELFNLLKIKLTLGRWMPGFLTNFKIYYNFVLKKLVTIFELIRFKRFRNWFVSRFHKFWFFFLLLKSHKRVSSAAFSLDPNPWIVSESRNIVIPSMVLLDSSSSQQVLNQTTYIIPFNFQNLNGLMFLLLCLNKIFLKSILNKKKFYFLLSLNFLKAKITNFFFQIKQLDYGFSLISNLLRYEQAAVWRKIGPDKNPSHIYFIYLRLLAIKLLFTTKI